MATINERDIDILNDLIETTLDSADGYREAAKAAKNPVFKSLFERRAMERSRLTADLQSEVRRLGGEPEDDGTVLAAAHRMFLNLKNSVTGSDKSVINEVEAGEDHIKKVYEDSLADRDLSGGLRTLINRIYAAIKADHDQMRDLKHQLQNQAAE